MTGFGSPCGACKFLRRKCINGCIFAPYFCHEQGATHFAAIHKVFGASNVSKLLAHLPVTDRCEAAVTISYEAQARLQDPIYGCVSHIFALQQQVVSLQAQLATLKELQASSSSSHGSGTGIGIRTENPNNEKFCRKVESQEDDDNTNDHRYDHHGHHQYGWFDQMAQSGSSASNYSGAGSNMEYKIQNPNDNINIPNINYDDNHNNMMSYGRFDDHDQEMTTNNNNSNFSMSCFDQMQQNYNNVIRQPIWGEYYYSDDHDQLQSMVQNAS
ncbi:hypothetical protein CsatA_014846 [Cannabis sativa]